MTAREIVPVEILALGPRWSRPSYTGQCERCNWFTDGKSATRQARAHTAETGHTVYVLKEQGWYSRAARGVQVHPNQEEQ